MALRTDCYSQQVEIDSKIQIGQKISIVGSGVVGQATGIGLAHHGNNVVFNDTNMKKILNLKSKGYKATKDFFETVYNSDIVFICVPTPTTNGQIDLSFVKSTIKELGKALKKVSKYRVLVFRSTILPQTTRKFIIPRLEKKSGQKAGKDFGVCMNPEFLRERNPLEDFLHPARIIIGELDRKSGDILESLYYPFNCPIIRTNLDTAEMIKYTSNLFLASKISFFNEFYMTCTKLGINSQTVSEATSLDPRIGKYGIYGGKPFGGTCFPKDLAAFLAFTKSNGLSSRILNATDQVNKEIAKFKNNEGRFS